LNSKNKVDEVRLASVLADHFRQQYLRATAVAQDEAAVVSNGR